MKKKKIKRIDHVFGSSLAAMAAGGSMLFYFFEMNGSMLIPAFFALGAFVFGFVLALNSIQSKRSIIYQNFVVQLVFLSLSLVTFGVIASLSTLK